MDTQGAQGAEQGLEADTILHCKHGLEEKERARAKGGGQDSKRINGHRGEQRRDGRVCASTVRGGERMNGRRVSWRHSASARPSESGAEEAAEADLLASASRRA
eukprot:5585336-Pleurochrysis_carterae.AAC.1